MKKHLLLPILALVLLDAPAAYTMAHSNMEHIRIQVCKRKEQTIRITPNPSRDGVITVASESKAPLFFYVFDMEGTLIHQVQLAPGAQSKIRIWQKGVYAYDVFRNDEGVEQGKITVL